jgi:ABC-type multidrug transport system fused ATPase/permease subunit
VTPPLRGTQENSGERARNLSGTAMRMLRRLAPMRFTVIAILALSVSGIAITAISPRILGHATDLIFDGVIGARLPSGIDKAQAVAEARARGDANLADMLSAMNVVPGRGVDFTAVAHTLSWALLLYLVAALLIWIQARLLNVLVQRTLAGLRTEVEAKVHRVPVRYFDSRPRGELMSRVTNDVDNIAVSVSMTVNQLLSSMLTLLTVLVMMATISPMLTAIAVVSVPLTLWASRAITRRSRKLFAAQWRNTGLLNAHAEETYSGYAVVSTYGHRQAARERFAERNDELYRSGLGAQFVSGLIGPATTFVGNLSYVVVAVVGGVQVATGQITLGGIQAFITYVRQFNQPLSQIAGMYTLLQSGLASAERVFEFLDEPEVDEPEEDADGGGAPPGPAGGAPRIEFSDVEFGYRSGRPVLRGLSLTAEAGSTVGIVGPTGAGKTTVVNLLMRFYDPDGGRIYYDGVDIGDVDRAELRSRIALVSQDTWLFDGTIADNIGYSRLGAGRDEIEAAARSAFVDHFAATLPKGYDTAVGESTLSTGQRQLISLARAFLAHPDVLVLDEATSSVDTRTELAVQRALTELRRNRTCFIIAHRLSTVRDADAIVVVEGGRVVESGPPAALLARGGAYRDMVRRATAPVRPDEPDTPSYRR